jgi:NDP-mannose synthase
MSKRAIILAGGKGTRLKPYTVVLPKPLMPIGEFSILEIIIRQLAYYGFDRVTLSINDRSEIIRAFLGDGKKWNIKIDYSLESQPLGTMGPLKIIKDLPDNFLIMNGDILTDLNFAEFYNYHIKQRNIFTVSAYEKKLKLELGVLNIGPDNKLKGFQEKPMISHNVSMGIYMVNKAAVKLIPAKEVYGFDTLMLDLIKRHNPAGAKIFKGHWLDIGTPQDYAQAIEQFDELKTLFLK